jgi:hypothetical protein
MNTGFPDLDRRIRDCVEPPESGDRRAIFVETDQAGTSLAAKVFDESGRMGPGMA